MTHKGQDLWAGQRARDFFKALAGQNTGATWHQVAFKQVSLQRLLHFPASQAEESRELLKEYLRARGIVPPCVCTALSTKHLAAASTQLNQG